MSKTQVGGDHYTKLGITPFEYSMANGLDSMQHTAIKYITRFRDKQGIVDLEKARDTIEQLIEYEIAKLKPKDSLIDWTALMVELSASVASKLENQIDKIVILPRGGLTLGHMIAEHLNIKDVSLFNSAASYTGSRVLLVDDINDTGGTLIQALRRPGAFQEVRTVVLAQRQSSMIDADYIGAVVNHDEYVVFPWEASLKKGN